MMTVSFLREEWMNMSNNKHCAACVLSQWHPTETHIQGGHNATRPSTHHDSASAASARILWECSHRAASDARSWETRSWRQFLQKAIIAITHTEYLRVSIRPKKPQQSLRCRTATPTRMRPLLEYYEWLFPAVMPHLYPRHIIYIMGSVLQ